MRYPRLTTALSFTLILLCAVAASAQSGRRKTAPPPAAPIPTPTPEPTPVPKKDNKDADIFFLVGADRAGNFTIPSPYYDAAVRGCADRLGSRSSADVDVADRDLGRGDAIKKAKSDTKTWVIVISLAYDSMARSADDIIVEYVVFAPETAKVVTTGRSYLNSQRAGPLVVGPPARGGGTIFREQLFRYAGEDAADRILKAMKLGTIPIPR